MSDPIRARLDALIEDRARLQVDIEMVHVPRWLDEARRRRQAEAALRAVLDNHCLAYPCACHDDIRRVIAESLGVTEHLGVDPN